VLRNDLRERIKALKTIIPDEIDARTEAVVDLRSEVVVDLSDGRDGASSWIEDERIVDLPPPEDEIPLNGLGAVPPIANPVFRALDRADRELAHLIAAGMTDDEIALVLDVAPSSVSLGVRSLLSLTGYETRIDLMVGWHTG
jgi:DNA-binding NarL/FixJ family response regulator